MKVKGSKAEEIKPRIVNQHSVVCCFKCDLYESNYDGYTTRLLFQRIADHRYSAIGRHLRDAHGNITIEFMFAGINMFWARLSLIFARAARRGLK